MEIENIQAGYTRVIRFLRSRGYIILNTNPINEGRYIICDTDKGKIMVMFKREFFFKFGQIFKSQGASGIGESLNILDLKKAINYGVDRLFFIYPNAHIYSIYVEDFLANSFRRETEEGKITRSISIHKLVRENL